MTENRTQQQASTAAFTAYMTRHGMRKTPERYAIYERMLSMPHHFFIDDLYNQMESEGYHVSRATIYNTVNMLVDAGLVRRHKFGNSPAQYEKISGPVTHHHLVCTECGKIKEIVDPEIDAVIEQRSYRGFTPQHSEINIYGICRQCQRKIKNKPNKPNYN